jgi:hypothetical protein
MPAKRGRYSVMGKFVAVQRQLGSANHRAFAGTASGGLAGSAYERCCSDRVTFLLGKEPFSYSGLSRCLSIHAMAGTHTASA